MSFLSFCLRCLSSGSACSRQFDALLEEWLQCSAGSTAFYYSAFSFSLDATLQIFKWVPTRLQTAWRSLKIATDIIAIPGTVMPAGSGVSCLSLKHIVKDVEKAAALILQSARAPTACTLSRHTSSSPLFTWIDFVFSFQMKESINWLCQLQSRPQISRVLVRCCQKLCQWISTTYSFKGDGNMWGHYILPGPLHQRFSLTLLTRKIMWFKSGKIEKKDLESRAIVTSPISQCTDKMTNEDSWKFHFCKKLRQFLLVNRWKTGRNGWKNVTVIAHWHFTFHLCLSNML